MTLPIWPGIIVFAGAFGTAAAQKGLTLGQAMGMSVFMFAGASQMVAIEVWQDTWSLATILGATAITAIVNSRSILMGAAVQPWIRGAPQWQNAATLGLLTDANWLIGMRYHGQGGRDRGILLGAGLALWLVWTAATLPGYLAGALVSEPKRLGLDLVMPIFFAAMLVPLWRGPRPALPWAIAGIVALAVQQVWPGYAFIIVGALAGVISGALLDERA